VPGALVRRRRLRAISMALIVGLIFAAGLAFLLYAVAYRKFGFG
jgi:capsular polysaccharide biosynthesis protein